MTSSTLEKYREEAQALGEPRRSLGVPASALFQEAQEIVKFVRTHWEPQASTTDGELAIPGLAQVNGQQFQGLPEDIAEQILELLDAALEAQKQCVLIREYEEPSRMPAAVRLLAELKSALAFVFGGTDARSLRPTLGRLAQLHARPDSHDAMALALDDYAALAARHAAALDGIGGFSASTIAEAHATALRLRSRYKSKNPARCDALRLRNQIWTLLHDRIRQVRHAARFVFRNHPEILARASSTYRRRARRKSAR